MTDASLYEDDIVAWADRQAAELRRLAASGSSNTVDWANVIEEVESVGRSQQRAAESLIINAFVHLLKLASDPGALSTRLWTREVEGFLEQASSHLTPSISVRIDLNHLWERACLQARRELELYGRALDDAIPRDCPLTIAELMSAPLDADRLLGRVRSAESR